MLKVQNEGVRLEDENRKRSNTTWKHWEFSYFFCFCFATLKFLFIDYWQVLDKGWFSVHMHMNTYICIHKGVTPLLPWEGIAICTLNTAQSLNGCIVWSLKSNRNLNLSHQLPVIAYRFGYPLIHKNWWGEISLDCRWNDYRSWHCQSYAWNKGRCWASGRCYLVLSLVLSCIHFKS